MKGIESRLQVSHLAAVSPEIKASGHTSALVADELCESL